MTSELKSAFERGKMTAQPADGKYFDYTSLIVNPSFETGNYDGWVLDNNTSGWFDARTWSDRPSDDGNLFLSIAAGEITSLNLYQDIKNLPLGEYIVTAALRNTGGTEFLTDQHIYAKINEDEPISSDTLKTVSGDNNNNWTTLSAKFFITSDKDNARIGAFSTGDGQKGWFQTDNFRLQYYGRTAAGIATDKEGNSFIIFHNPHGIDIKTDKEITVNIFNINGSIFKTVNLSAGYNHIPLSKGVYVINGEKIVL